MSDIPTRPPVTQRLQQVDNRPLGHNSTLRVDPEKARVRAKQRREEQRQRAKRDGKPTRQLNRSRRQQTRMSANAKVQQAMLGKGRCWLTDAPDHNCTDGETQRSHVVSQQAIRDAYKHGAYWSDLEECWVPRLADDDYPEYFTPTRTLQEILDDSRNLVPTCPNGNRDGAVMRDALEEVGYPEGFDDFKAEYRFHFNGRYWDRLPS